MTWTKLQQFINSLTEEQLQQDVIIRDNYGDHIHADIYIEVSEDTIFYNLYEGIMEGKYLTPEEFAEAQEDASFIIEPHTPYLVIL